MEDAAALGQVPVEAPTAAEGKDQSEEKGGPESPFSLDFPKLILRDTWHVLTSPARWDAQDWLKVGIGIAGIAAVSLAGQSVRTQVLHIQSGSAKDAASQIRLFGDYYSYATLGLFYVGGEIFHDPPARGGSWGQIFILDLRHLLKHGTAFSAYHRRPAYPEVFSSPRSRNCSQRP